MTSATATTTQARPASSPRRPPATSPAADVERARTKVQEASDALREVERAQAAVLDAARATFDKDPTEANADALAVTERRVQLLVERARKVVDDAQAALTTAQEATKSARLAELDAKVSAAAQAAADLAKQGKVHLEALIQLADRATELVNEGAAAAQEASRLRDVDPHPAVMGARSAYNVFIGGLRSQLQPGQLYALRQLLGG